MIRIIMIFIVFFSIAVLAEAPRNKIEFCQRTKDLQVIQDFLDDQRNLLAFKNSGGLLGGGVCWWHSMFTRSAANLVIFKEDRPKPSLEEAESIIKKIAYDKTVVEVPGYANLKSFSSDFKKEIQRRLNIMQRRDGFLKQHWILGLWGRAKKTSADKLYRLIKKIEHKVIDLKQIVYLKLQIPGITSHSWLVNRIEQFEDTFHLNIIDSNFSKTITYKYQIGDNNFRTKRYGRFVPHIGKMKTYKKFENRINTFCKTNIKMK